MARTFGSLAFTPEVKGLQEEYGSRKQYERMGERGPEHNALTEVETTFLQQRDSFYWASTGSNGWPYIQHRGGPKGFLKIMDERTIAFADFSGNKQYITAGNLVTDDRVATIFVDYALRARLKILGHARVLEGEELREWLLRYPTTEQNTVVERVFRIAVEAFDWNCPQHITPRYTQEDVESAVKQVVGRVERLERENAALREEVSRLKEVLGSSSN